MKQSDSSEATLLARHLAFGWSLLAVSIVLGLGLEVMHALKVGFYLDAGSETRRLLWTLAHAHGTLLGLVHIAFSVSLPRLTGLTGTARSFASRALLAGACLLPAGFFLGGAVVYEGDPGVAIILAPAGAVALVAALIVIALGARSSA
jgi:hypothetical protein